MTRSNISGAHHIVHIMPPLRSRDRVDVVHTTPGHSLSRYDCLHAVRVRRLCELHAATRRRSVRCALRRTAVHTRLRPMSMHRVRRGDVRRRHDAASGVRHCEERDGSNRATRVRPGAAGRQRSSACLACDAQCAQKQRRRGRSRTLRASETDPRRNARAPDPTCRGLSVAAGVIPGRRWSVAA